MTKIYKTEVKNFIEKYAPPFYGDTWPEVVSSLLSEPTEAAIIDELIMEYRRDQGFRKPILVGYDDENNTDSIENGTHRTVAAILMGEETPIEYKIFPQEDTPEYDEWYSNLEEERYYEIILTAPSDLTEEERKDQFEYVIDRFRSFKVTDEYWLDSALASIINGGPVNIFFAHTGDIEDVREDIITTIKNKIKENEKLTRYIKNVEIVESKDEDEEE